MAAESANKTKFKSLDKIASSEKVKLIYQDDDGIWVELTDGWGHNECISFKGQNCADVIDQFKDVEPYQAK